MVKALIEFPSAILYGELNYNTPNSKFKTIGQ